MIIGYARVSTAAQDFKGQVERLKAAGAEQVFGEHASGAYKRRRPELSKALAMLKAGDVFLVVRMDRFARSSVDAMNIMAEILDRGAEFRSLEEGWADTTTPAGKFMATLLMGWAEFDRAQILARTAEGRAAARAAGVRMGRPPTLNGRQRRFAIRERQKTPPTPYRVIASVLRSSVRTLKRVVAEGMAAAGDDAGEQTDLEERLRQVGHYPTCAVFTSGLGMQPRCTCGGTQGAGATCYPAP